MYQAKYTQLSRIISEKFRKKIFMEQFSTNPFQQPKNPDTQEKKVKASKLDGFCSQDLIPPGLEKTLRVVGELQGVVHRQHGHVDFVIKDAAKMTSRQIENGFTYFCNAIEDFPELKLGKDQYSRTLVYGSVREISPDMLYEGLFETNPATSGKGVGVAFQEHLATLAKKLGYKFLASYQNNAEIARFFLNRGRYLLEEIRDELRNEFKTLQDQEDDPEVFFTIKFLNPEDVVKYVRPERLDTDVEDKIEFREKITTLKDIFNRLAKTFKKVDEGKDDAGDRTTLIEILEDLNQILPEEDRHNMPGLSEDDENLVLKLKVLFEHLKSKSSVLIREATLEELEENVI